MDGLSINDEVLVLGHMSGLTAAVITAPACLMRKSERAGGEARMRAQARESENNLTLTMLRVSISPTVVQGLE